MNIEMYIKKYSSLILIIIIGLMVKSSIDPYVFGDEFNNKKVNKEYRVKVTDLDSNELKEVSGLAYSNQNKFFWAHNDSGNSSDIYALDISGKIRIIVELKDIENVDFEDISLRTYNNKNTLYIADVGNNDYDRDQMYIYKFEEPVFPSIRNDFSEENIILKLKADRLSFDVSNLDVNFEAMMVENSTGKIFLIEKKKSKEAKIYFIPKFNLDENTNKLSYFGKIDFGVYGKQEVLAIDISKDDKDILIKTKSSVFILDKSNFRKNITSDMLKQMPYVEEYQGEAITWSEKSLGYYTLSESKGKKSSTLYYYRNVYK